MALADPQSIKINGVTTSLPRVSTGNFESIYQSEDGTIAVKASTQNGRRKRQVFRLDQNKITADPFDTTQNVEISQSIYIVFDRPNAGFTNTDALKALEGFVELLSATTYTVAKKVLASES